MGTNRRELQKVWLGTVNITRIALLVVLPAFDSARRCICRRSDVAIVIMAGFPKTYVNKFSEGRSTSVSEVIEMHTSLSNWFPSVHTHHLGTYI